MTIGDWLTAPWNLLLLLAIPPLVAWWLFQGRNALRHSATRLVSGSLTRRAWLARWGGATLRALALLLLVLTLAGPRWPSEERTRIETEGIAIVMVVDVSGSMSENDFDWDGKPKRRIDAVKEVFHLFVAGGTAPAGPDGQPVSFAGRSSDMIGLVTFAARPEKACPLTLSHSALLHMLDASEPKKVPGEAETNITDALAVALDRLYSVGPDRKKVLILLTDGEHNVADPRSLWKKPQYGAQIGIGLKIPIYTIDAGAGDTADPMRTQAKETLDELAKMTNGRSFQAHDSAGLLQACQAIDQLEPEPIRSFEYRLYDPLYMWFGLASFVAFLTLLLLELTFWRRVP